MNGLSPKTRKNLLYASGIILLIAIVWLINLESKSYTRDLCTRINSFGYNVAPGDLNIRSYGKDISISEVMDEDLFEVELLSAQCGFNADTAKKGLVELALWRVDEDRIMVIYLVDRTPELAFIENTSTGEVLPIG